MSDQSFASAPGSLQPSLGEFLNLAAKYPVVPVWREMMGDLETPVAAFAKLVGEGSGFLLESVEHGGQWGRFSFVGRDPSAVVVAKRDSTGKASLTATGVLPEGIRLEEGVLTALDDILRAYDAPQHPDLPPLTGGVVGYLGYDIIRHEMALQKPQGFIMPHKAALGAARERLVPVHQLEPTGDVANPDAHGNNSPAPQVPIPEAILWARYRKGNVH